MKYRGDDAYSWQIFVDRHPAYYGGLTKSEVPYYKKKVLEIILQKET